MADVIKATYYLRHSLMENGGECKDIEISLSKWDYCAAMVSVRKENIPVVFDTTPQKENSFLLNCIRFVCRE